MKTRYIDQELESLSTSVPAFFDTHVRIHDIRLTNVDLEQVDIDFVQVGIQVRQAFSRAPIIMAPGVYLTIVIGKLNTRSTDRQSCRIEIDYETLTPDQYRHIKDRYRL